MDRYLLNTHAFSLAEIAIVLSVLAVLLSAVLSLKEPVLNRFQEIKTEADLNALAQACRDFYGSRGQWPSHVEDLQPDFLSPQVAPNDYAFDPQAKILIISSIDSSQTVLKPAFR